MSRPPCHQYDNLNDVDEHRNNDDGENDDDHRGAVETNAGESDGDEENWDSPAFAVEAIHQFNANVIAFNITTGDRRWYILGCYLAPF